MCTCQKNRGKLIFNTNNMLIHLYASSSSKFYNFAVNVFITTVEFVFLTSEMENAMIYI